MSQKKSTPAILFSLLLTMLLGGVWWLSVWWFSQSGRESRPSNPTASSPAPSSNSVSALSFAQVQNVPAGLFSYGGSTAWERIRIAIELELQVSRREFRLRHVNYSATDTPSSAVGINSLLNGQLAFSLSSRPIENEEFQQAQQRGFTLTSIPVAIDGLVFLVHPDLNLAGLTLEQLKDIYLGKLTNWQQVGGPNLPIVALSHDPKAGGIVDLFIDDVLGRQPMASSVQFFKTTINGVRKVAQTPGAIYVDAASEVIAQCNVKPIAIGRTPDKLIPPYEGTLVTRCPEQSNRLNRAAFQSGEYPLRRTLLVIVKQNQRIEQQAGEAYANLLLSQAGQAVIAKTGLVPIR